MASQQTKEMDHYFNVYAPPAFTFPQSLQPQIPTAFLFTAYCAIFQNAMHKVTRKNKHLQKMILFLNENSDTFPQNSQKYLLCWLTSIFLICFRRLAP